MASVHPQHQAANIHHQASDDYSLSLKGGIGADSKLPQQNHSRRPKDHLISSIPITPSNPAPFPLHHYHEHATPSHPVRPTLSVNPDCTPSHPPLPLLPLASAQVTSSRTGALLRRKLSVPPAAPPSNPYNVIPWSIGEPPQYQLPQFDTQLGNLPGYGTELERGMSWTDGLTCWEGLLDLDQHPKSATPGKIPPTSEDPDLVDPHQSHPPTRTRSAPLVDTRSKAEHTSSRHLLQDMLPTDIAQFGSDLAWKTIMGSVVDVAGVGEVGVARVLQEVWKRGGGDAVTAQYLWPSIIMSLSLLPDITGSTGRIPTPSRHAAVALQELYSLTLRPWEPSIFAGLLGSYICGTPPIHLPVLRGSTPIPVFGAVTPSKEHDLSQWTNSTPGGDTTSLFMGSGLTPHDSGVPDLSLASLAQFEFYLGQEDPRRASICRTDDDHARGINELLAAMEEGNEARQAAAFADDSTKAKKPKPTSRANTTFQVPTPETDLSESPARPEDRQRSVSASDSASASRNRSLTFSPPDSMASPFVTASSSTLSAVSKTLSATSSVSHTTAISQHLAGWNRAHPPTLLQMPTAPFVPPPPMCMFFSPAFKDLQRGKVGVWKGELEVKGRGGGKFNILIVGEETTGHLWQSQQWPSTIAYPPDTSADGALSTLASGCTSSMIPVAHLAREGFTPAAMGMVLCNDVNIQAYVNMVQGLHAEGVAFHLTNPGRLPVVFLPAKFDSSDPLQRLGVAFMTKPGMPKPPMPTPASSSTNLGKDGGPKRKRRRQSAPPKPSAAALKKRESLASSAKVAKVPQVDEEAVTVEDV